MLSERQLEGLLQVFEARYSDIADEYLRRMGEHIRDIGTLHPSDVHRLTEMKRMRANTRDIRQKIARAAGLTLKDVDRVFRSVAASNEKFARAYFGSNQAAHIRGSGRLEKLIKAQLRQTAQTMQNLSNTTVVTDAYRKAVDRGISAVISGADDYGAAIRRTLAEAGGEGLRVTYASGHTRRIDTAVRQNVLDGVRQLNQDTLMQLGKDFGADGVEIDAHMLCAEDHLPYQGGQFSNEEFQEIQDSLDRPFGEWNCRHTWHPILLGISQPTYTPDQLEEMRAYSTEKIEIDGAVRTRYEWSQELRRMETEVRRQKDTATLARAAGDATLRRQCQSSIEDLQKRYESTADAAGLTADWSRMNVRGFRDAESSTAAAKRGIMAASKYDASVDWATVSVRKTSPLQHGFSAFPEEDLLTVYTARIKPEDGFYDIAMHGTTDAVLFGTKTASLTPGELAEFIKHREDYHGENIRLFSCNTGKVVNDDYCFAEHLANALGVAVKAPTDLLFVKQDGTFFVGKRKDGTFRTFKPNERRRIK